MGGNNCKIQTPKGVFFYSRPTSILDPLVLWTFKYSGSSSIVDPWVFWSTECSGPLSVLVVPTHGNLTRPLRTCLLSRGTLTFQAAKCCRSIGESVHKEILESQVAPAHLTPRTCLRLPWKFSWGYCRFLRVSYSFLSIKWAWGCWGGVGWGGVRWVGRGGAGLGGWGGLG